MCEENRVHKLRRLMYRFKNVRRPEKGKDHMRMHDMMMLVGIQKVGNGEAVKMSQLSSYFKITAPAVSQIMRKLEDQGYIERIIRDEDRRSVYVKVSEKAIKEIKTIQAHMDKTLIDMIDYLGEEDTDELIRLLDKVLSYMDEQEGVRKC